MMLAAVDAPSTDLVRQVDWIFETLLVDPWYATEMEEVERETKAWAAAGYPGATFDNVQLRDEVDKMHPGLIHRYPLPAHLHWMGEP
jgi:hypothetical protein